MEHKIFLFFTLVPSQILTDNSLISFHEKYVLSWKGQVIYILAFEFTLLYVRVAWE